MAKKFTWDTWNFDGNGSAYIIDKSQCPKKENVPDFICQVDELPKSCKPSMAVEEGWCKWQVRSDWDDDSGCAPSGGYVVLKRINSPMRPDGKKQRGWFPVWIVRKGKWY